MFGTLTRGIIAVMKESDIHATKFHALLQDQIYNEFTAAQQYLAIAVYFDADDLPQLAKFFYGQAAEERHHALMLVQYLIDRDMHVEIPGTGAVRNHFDEPHEALLLALTQEREVTDQVSQLAGVARDEGDYIGEQFMQWFLKEQVEEVSVMSSLVRVAERAGHNMFDLENFIARDLGTTTADASAPRIAGGGV